MTTEALSELYTLEDLAREALKAHKEIVRLTARYIEPAKERFRIETIKLDEGILLPIDGLGVVETRKGSPASRTVTYTVNPDKLSVQLFQELLSVGAIEQKITTRKASQPSVIFKLT